MIVESEKMSPTTCQNCMKLEDQMREDDNQLKEVEYFGDNIPSNKDLDTYEKYRNARNLVLDSPYQNLKRWFQKMSVLTTPIIGNCMANGCNNGKQKRFPIDNL